MLDLRESQFAPARAKRNPAATLIWAGVWGCSALCGAFAIAGMAGCFTVPDGVSITTITASSSPSPSPTYSVAGGTMAAKFIFTDTSTGSFDTAPVGGTSTTPGSGLQAQRVYELDGSTLIASGGPTASAWPKWISGLELGISGASNTKATSADCARFSSADASSCCTDTLCGTTFACNGPSDTFRVSEYDCANGTYSAGNGTSDGVYIRLYLNRNTTYLGSSENLMAVLEYSASAYNAVGTSGCFNGTTIDPDNCADFTWRVYMRTGTGDTPSPFMLLVPPTYSYLASNNAQPGLSGYVDRQIFVPLSANPSVTVLQFSQNALNLSASGNFAIQCDHAGTASSPLCAGMVINSLALYRM